MSDQEQSYEDAWNEDHPPLAPLNQVDSPLKKSVPEPTENPVRAAAKASAEADAKEFSDAFHSDTATASTPGAKGASTSGKPAPAKAMGFKETFAAQRKAGAKIFEWNGKLYTTELAGTAGSSTAQKAKTPPAAAPVEVAAKTQPRVVAAATAPAQATSPVRTSAPSGRNYTPVIPAKVVDSPVRTSAPSGRNYAYVPDAAPTKEVASPIRTSSPSGRNYAYVPDAAPQAVASPARTSAPSGRNYTPAQNVVRNTEDAE
jgi:hypothetical protein